MAAPLFPIVALLTSTHARPPVPTERVTGNVSTEHAVKPVVDSCRVVGNIVNKVQCDVGGGLVVASYDAATEPRACFAKGAWIVHEGTRVCEIPLIDGFRVRIPAGQVVPEKTS